MRRLLLALLLVLGFAAAAHAGDAFSDFRIPDHHEHFYDALFSIHVDQNSYQHTPYSSWSRLTAPSVQTDARWFMDSEPMQWDGGVAASANGSWFPAWQRQDFPRSMSIDASRDKAAAEHVDSHASLRLYPYEAPIGFTAEAVAATT